MGTLFCLLLLHPPMSEILIKYYEWQLAKFAVRVLAVVVLLGLGSLVYFLLIRRRGPERKLSALLIVLATLLWWAELGGQTHIHAALDIVNTWTANQIFKSINGAFFVSQFAAGSTTGGVQECYNGLPAAGGTCYVDPNYTASFTSTFSNVATKPVDLVGFGETSVISGSGITLVSLSGNVGIRNKVRNLKITDPTGNASTVGLSLGIPGGTGIEDTRIDNVVLIGTNKLGIGLRLDSSLTGVIQGCKIEGWNVGLQYGASATNVSNANDIRGNHLSRNATGLQALSGSAVKDIYLTGNIVELNTTMQVDLQTAKLTATANHFESPTPTTILIQVSGQGRLVSQGNFFANATANSDIVITSTSGGPQLSLGDSFSTGVTSNLPSSNSLIVVVPIGTYTTAGTGLVDTLTFQGATNIGFSEAGTPARYFQILGYSGLTVTGAVPTTLGISTFAGLPTALSSNGSMVYCSDCLKASNPCSGVSTGTFALRVNAAWVCF